MARRTVLLSPALGTTRPSPAVLRGLVVALLLLVVTLLAPVATAAADPPQENQCNGVDNTGGLELECHVVVANALDLSTGVGSSTVTLEECHGAAGADPTCTTTTTAYTGLTTSVVQCNGSGLLGGSNITCTVEVVNTVTGTEDDTTPATVNQCVGSGAGGGTEPTLDCGPFPANTTGATVTQCNGSGNGGGGSQRVRCTVDTASTTSESLAVTIDQCNGSANEGGATVTCSASVRHLFRDARVITTPPVVTPPVVTLPDATSPVLTPAVVTPVVAAPVVAAPLVPDSSSLTTTSADLTSGADLVDQPRLPVTGSATGRLTLSGLLLAGLGAVLVLVSRPVVRRAAHRA